MHCQIGPFWNTFLHKTLRWVVYALDDGTNKTTNASLEGNENISIPAYLTDLRFSIWSESITEEDV